MMRPPHWNQRQRPSPLVSTTTANNHNRGNYSLAPSKIFMGHNTGLFVSHESEISKQRREQSREIREAQMQSNSSGAVPLLMPQKKVKYFSVASTIRRPRRLEKIN